MTSTGPKDQGPLPPLLLTLTVVTGVVDAVSILRLGVLLLMNASTAALASAKMRRRRRAQPKSKMPAHLPYCWQIDLVP